MRGKTINVYNQLKSKIVIILLLTLTGSCNSKNNTQAIQQTETSVDSVQILIENSTKPGLLNEQSSKLIDRAYSLATSSPSDSLSAKRFSLLSKYFYTLKDSSRFRETNRQAILYNTIIKDSLTLAKSYNDLGQFFTKYNVRDSSYYAYTRTHKIYEGLGNNLMTGRTLLSIAAIQSNILDYSSSEISTARAIELLKPLKNNKDLIKCYNQLGIVMGAVGETKKSLEYFNEALFYIKKEGNSKLQLARINNNIGVAFRNNNEQLKAKKYFERVLQTDSLKYKQPIGYAVTLSNIADNKLILKDTTGINDILLTTIKIKKEQKHLSGLSNTYHTYSQYRAYTQDTLAAIQLAKKAEKLASKYFNNETLLDIWTHLSLLKKDDASLYMKKYIHLNDSLHNEERKQRDKFARIRFETNEFIAQNESLEGQKNKLSRQKQIWISIAIGLFLLSFAIYIIIVQRIKNQKLRFIQQEQTNKQELFNLLLYQKQQVAEVKRLEQKRISEELHDGVLGKMLGARMILTGLNKRSSTDAVEEKSRALKSLQKVENEIRVISHELSHNAYKQINNFTDSITSLLQNNYKDKNIDTLFTFNEDEDWDGLEGEIKINVYRIIQETFQNAMKHANCSSFQVSLHREDSLLKVVLNDNGSGFKPKEGEKGIGLKNINSRMDKLKGRWNINSVINIGTTITLEIPIKN